MGSCRQASRNRRRRGRRYPRAGLSSNRRVPALATCRSPEQALGDWKTDQRADIYALGVVGYEMLAGMTPFFGTTPQQVLTAHVAEIAAPVSRYRPDLPPSLAAAI